MNLQRRAFVLAGSLAALAVLVVAAPRRAHAGCALTVWAPELLSRDPVPAHGALVVALVRTAQVPPAWLTPAGAWTSLTGRMPTAASLARGAETIALRIEPLAPGLARWVPDRTPGPGRWTLAGLPRPTEVEFVAAANPATPAAPVLRAARHRSARMAASTREPAVSVTAEVDLATAPPRGAVAVLVSWNRDATPAAFARVLPGRTTVTLYQSPSRCTGELPGRSPPPGSVTVQVAWVSAAGAVSPASTAVPMRRATSP